MNRLLSIRLGALLCFGLMASVPAIADGAVDTVNWAAASGPSSSGSGTLSSGTIAVGYTTFLFANLPGKPSSGATINPVGWDTSLATSTAVGTGVTNDSGVVLATPGSGSQTQTVTFSSPVTDPILYFCHAASSESITLSDSFTVLDSNNAQVSGSIIDFAGATGSVNDGLAAQLSGTFSTISFNTSNSAGSPDLLGLTVGLESEVASTPEPGTLALLATCGLTGGIFLKRRRGRKR